jgi:hypothetical protein
LKCDSLNNCSCFKVKNLFVVSTGRLIRETCHENCFSVRQDGAYIYCANAWNSVKNILISCIRRSWYHGRQAEQIIPLISTYVSGL